MRHLFYISFLVLIGFAFSACDYVANAVETTPQSGGNTDTTRVYRKVLVEDFTGHKCQNCPKAAREMHRLDSLYHEKIVPLAIHAGTFANVNAQYPDDFRTPEGTEINNFFGFSAYPNGLVSRIEYSSSADFIKGYDLWETSAAPLMQELADFKIEINNTFNTGNNQLTSVVNVKALNDLTGKYNLCVFLTEDSIIGPQLDGSTIIPDFVFMHVLRGSLNSAWGEEIWNGSITKDQVQTKTYTYNVSTGFVPKNCHVIAFVYDNDSNSGKFYEVKQAEMKEMTE